MNQEKNITSAESFTALRHQYTACINMLSQTNTRRTATVRFYISLTSGLVGLLALAHRPSVDAETQLLVTNIVAILSIFLNGVWFITIRSLRHLATVQRTLLKDMEELLPYPFITRQEQMMQQSSGWLNTGNIEQYLPLAMMIPAAWILVVTNLR